MQVYKTVRQYGEGEIEEKKSRFLGKVQPVATEQEALEFIEHIKKQYWDARHNCYAYIIGEHGEFSRCSDDGEPSGTAGRPMLELLQNQELKNVVVVVTRYFGGTLLGTGGLVRAYTQATQAALEQAQIAAMTPAAIVSIGADYNASGKIKYLLEQEHILIQKEEYAADVTFTIAVAQIDKESLLKKLIDATNAKVRLEEIGSQYMAL